MMTSRERYLERVKTMVLAAIVGRDAQVYAWLAAMRANLSAG